MNYITGWTDFGVFKEVKEKSSKNKFDLFEEMRVFFFPSAQIKV